VIWQKIVYVHLNPVRAGLVAEPAHYLYSSASNYVNGTGLLEVEPARLSGGLMEPVVPPGRIGKF
jgi:hypothetical protein